MSDKEIFIAYVLDETEFGSQLLKYAFEYPITEYWGEPEEQEKLKTYFSKYHYSHDKPIYIEKSDIIDFRPYGTTPTSNTKEGKWNE